MTRPGVEIISRAQPVARSAPTDTGVWLIAGATTSAPVDGDGTPVPTLITSMTMYEAKFGVRGNGAAQPMYDAVETYFREGGAKVWVSATGAAETDALAALDRLQSGLGPGQVSCPGASDAATTGALLDHAAEHNRVALIDGPTSGDAAAMEAAGTALRTSDNARYGAVFAPGAVIPGVAPGTTRTVSMSAVVAGIIARNDVMFTPNQAAAGVNGVSLYALDLSATYTDQEYEDINYAGVNMGRVRFGTIENYGFVTPVDRDVDAQWWQFNWARMNMAIVAGGSAVAERYVFSQIDGRYRTISDFGGELAAMLVPWYERGALFGATADDAFLVNVGQQVNTPETIANGELRAVIEVRMSPFAELVVIEIVKVSTTQAVAAGQVRSLAQTAAA